MSIVPVPFIASLQPAGSTTPTLPAFTSPLLVAGLNNFNSGIPGNDLLESFTGITATALLVSPYPLDYATFISGQGPDFPALLSTWTDQNGSSNSLIQSNGAKQPVLAVTTSVTVTGGSQPGGYTYSGQFDFGAGAFAYYNLVSQPASTTNYCIHQNGDVGWIITDGSGNSIAVSDGNGVAFPWLDTWTGITVTPGKQKGEVQFGTDGAGNTASTGLQSTNNLVLATTATLYCQFKAGDLSETSVLLETSANGTTTAGAISLRLVAGVLTASVFSGAALNTKIKTISDTTDFHTACVVINTAAAAASQVLLYVDGSTTGVTAPISTDLAGQTLSNSKANVGSRNNAASNFFHGSMLNLPMFSVAHNPTLVGQWTSYLNYLPTA